MHGGEEVVQFMHRIWDTFAKDPLFANPHQELTLDQKRHLNFARLKRLHEYNFLTDDELVACPMKALALQNALLSYDGSLLPAYSLNAEVIEIYFGFFILTSA